MNRQRLSASGEHRLGQLAGGDLGREPERGGAGGKPGRDQDQGPVHS
jgi:hypothetical protein